MPECRSRLPATPHRRTYRLASARESCPTGRRMPMSAPTAIRAYDPFDYAIHEDPYPVYAWMREHAPVYRNEERDFWALSRHADVVAALKTRAVLQPQRHLAGAELWGPAAVRPVSSSPWTHPITALPRLSTTRSAAPGRRLEAEIRELARQRLEPLRDLRRSTSPPNSRRPAERRRLRAARHPGRGLGPIRADTDQLNQRADGRRNAGQSRRGPSPRRLLRHAGHVLRRSPAEDLTSACSQPR